MIKKVKVDYIGKVDDEHFFTTIKGDEQKHYMIHESGSFMAEVSNEEAIEVSKKCEFTTKVESDTFVKKFDDLSIKLSALENDAIMII
jgi:hypothetical protein